jgi:hypothetical protein
MAKKTKRPKKVAEVSEGSKKASRSLRNRERRRSRKQELSEPFDWDSVQIGGISHRKSDYCYRASTRCLRRSENSPPTPCGRGMHWQIKTRKGKVLWVTGFTKRSERDEFVREAPRKRKAKRRPSDFGGN